MFKVSYHAFGVAPVDRVNIPCSLGLVPIILRSDMYEGREKSNPLSHT
jgi:hypothetical protein